MISGEEAYVELGTAGGTGAVKSNHLGTEEVLALGNASGDVAADG